jgi:peroxiredoxin
MPRYIIERNFAEQLGLTKDAVESVNRVNEEEGVAWIFSFLSADKRKTYCLYEAPNPEGIRAAARRLNIPADAIIEIGGEIGPKMFG